MLAMRFLDILNKFGRVLHKVWLSVKHDW